MTGGTRPHAHVLLDLLALVLGVGLAVAPLEVRHDPLEARGVVALAAEAVAVANLDALAVRAVEEDLALLGGQGAPRLLDVNAEALGERGSHLLVVAGTRSRPRRERALRDREVGVRHDEVRVDLELRAEPGAALAGALRRVEGENARLELGHRGAALQAGELLRERQRLPRPLALARHDLHRHDPVRQRSSGLDRVDEALAHVSAHHQAVNDDRDLVPDVAVEVEIVLETVQLAVDDDPREALRAQVLEQLAELPLAAADDGRQDHEARALSELEDLVGDLLDRLPGDRLAANVAVRHADARPQQAQVVVDLRDRANRRARVARGRLLVDRDRRREPLDRVHVGLVHLPEELARVRRQRLDVAPATLRVDRVEGKRGLAGAREPGQHDERVARQRQRDVLEVVLARAGNDDLIGRRHVMSNCTEANRCS